MGLGDSRHRTRVLKVLELGGDGVTRVEQLSSQPHVDYFAQRTGELAVPAVMVVRP